MKDVEMKQYENLRNNIKRVSDHILGESYYNMGSDVYSADKEMCNDIIREYDKSKKLNDVLIISFFVFIIINLLYNAYL